MANRASVDRRRVLLAAGAGVLAAGAGARAQAGQALAIASASDVLSWDPIAHVHSAGMPIYRSVFDSPLMQSSKLELIPNVVSAWKWLDQGRTLELTFRDDVFFHNGDKLTSEDFKFSYFDRLRADKTLALAGVFGDVIDEIEIRSPTAAVVHMNRVMPLALPWMASIANFILPKNYFSSVGKSGFLAKPIGSGPYKLVDYQQGARVVLEANDRYWNGKPKSDRLVFEIVKEPSARVAAIQSGRVDLATSLPIREAERLNSVPGLVGEIKPVTATVVVLARDVGDFRDERVRRAAHLAIDKAALSRAFSGGKAAPLSVVGIPTMPGYAGDFTTPFDQNAAKRLLEEAGFGPDKPVRITFFSISGVQPNDWEMARAIVGMWAQVGIEAKLEPMEVAKYFELNAAGKLPEATFWYWTGPANDPEQFIGSLLDPDSRFSVWKSDDMREKLKPLLAEFDFNKRIAGYAEVSRYATERGYAIPLVQGVNGIAYKKALSFEWFDTGWYEPYRISRG